MTQQILEPSQLPNTDGWTPVTDTWAYASATTITVPSGAASIYSIGDKFKLTANSVVLYGYIITVADTLLTVVGDALTNYTFTNCNYSKVENPLGFGHWFSWIPSITSGSADLSGYDYAKFSISGRKVNIIFKAYNKSITGSAGSVKLSLPVMAVAGVTYHALSYYYFDETNWIHARNDLSTSVGVSYLELFAAIGYVMFAPTLTGRYVSINGSYEI